MQVFPSAHSRLLPLSASLLVLLSLTTPGCGFSIERVKPASETKAGLPQYKTPALAYQALHAAIEKHDYATAVNALSATTVEELAGKLLYQTSITKRLAENAMLTGEKYADALQQIIEQYDPVFVKHEITNRTTRNMALLTSEEINDPKNMRKLGRRLKKPHEFIADLLTITNRFDSDRPVITVPNGELVGLKTDGKTATATIETATIESDGPRVPISFVKQSEGWFVNLDVVNANKTPVKASVKESPTKATLDPSSNPHEQ